ncbi:uncharacterized protein LOC134222247 [Armigeres subalbatus]|uniref:uncharacterized protein LOC134222247 n=1 Tax=Armigeres subalbatus TaxID=124917 RepID=UPI002ED0C258
MAYVHRFVGNLKCKLHGQAKITGYLTQEELLQAETTLIRIAQQQAYPDEVMVLSRGNNHPRSTKEGLAKSSVLYSLTPFMDDIGIMRVDGRIRAAKHIYFEIKFPIILPKQHNITALLVDAYHRKFQHANSETVVNEMRQRYHVSCLRAVVRKIGNVCQFCKIQKAVPRIPRMAELPPARLASFTRPFTFVGLDLFGPLQVKVGRSNAKRWVALFTCLTIRAVHCEVVYSLSTDACMKSIRRFVCRRGAPSEIYSDNGTNFRGAERVLVKQIQQGLAATVTSTTTKFIPPSSPHMGGAWERMVRSVKQAMMGAYNSDRKLNDESLNTLIIEAEAIVNSRPLTYLPLDAEEDEALSPNHFLLGSSNGIRQPVAEPMGSSEAVKNSWNMIQHQLDSFWRRWIREMLPVLTKRTKWFGEEKMMETGDLVLIVEDNKRNDWTRGRVTEVIPGGDGRVRQAIVKTARGLLRRPASKLAILEVVGGKTGTGGQCYEGEDVAANTSMRR